MHELEELELLESSPASKKITRFCVNLKGPPTYQLCAAAKKNSLIIFSCAPRFEPLKVRADPLV